MSHTAAKDTTDVWFDNDGTIHIETSQFSIMRGLIKHPQATLGEAHVDENCKLTRGEWLLPFKCVRFILTGGEPEIEI